MKELSIEQKAKAYDELFIKAKQIYNKENDVLIMHTIEDLFPEVKEPDGEKIRKALIEHFKFNVQQILYDFSNKDVLAWLEKQGRVKESAISQHENRTCEENGNSLTSEDAIEREVKEDAGGYPYIDATELYDYENDKPLAKAGDKVKVVFIKDK